MTDVFEGAPLQPAARVVGGWKERAERAEAALAAVERLCEAAARNGAAAKRVAEANADIRARHYAMGCADGALDAIDRVRAAARGENSDAE